MVSTRPLALAVVLLAMTPVGCENYPFLPNRTTVSGANTDPLGGVFGVGEAFVENLIQERTFIDGTSITTITYARDDVTRSPVGIDFNRDGKIDPVAAYGRDQAVIQILLSVGRPGEVDYVSLTLDSKRDLADLADVAVGDIDADGSPDIVGAASEAVWYFHHPTDRPTTALSEWGNPDPTDELRERVEGSLPDPNDPNQNIEAIIAQAVGPGVNLDDYIVTVNQSYTNVEIADFDLDGDNDIAASRTFKISMAPRPEAPVEPILIVDGDVMVFENPGFATTGRGWRKISVGRHERQQRLDRDGAAGLVVYDLDGDGDLDLISAARDDNNVQVAWFENPGPPLDQTALWKQWRIGSVRDATAVDVLDLTLDGRPDVIATGGAQQQMLLFEQPESGPKRAFDWDTSTIVTFETYEPRDVKAIDIDNDGFVELVTSGTNGTVRYFETPPNPRDAWDGVIVHNFPSGGEVGLLGYGDLDGDNDLDLLAIVRGEQESASRLVWFRNNLNSVIDLSPESAP